MDGIVRDSGRAGRVNANERSFVLLFVFAGVERVGGVVVPIEHALGRQLRLTRNAVLLKKRAPEDGGRRGVDVSNRFPPNAV